MALLMALLVASAVAQIGTDICACQPSQFTMTLNFGLECDDRDIDESLLEGVEETACSVEDAISQTDPTDPFPVLVSRIVIIELDEAFQSVKTQEYTDTLVNGSEIVFISSTATSESVTTLNIPRGLQVQIYGVNAADEPLLNNYVVLFNQTCSVYPILTSGKQIGWTVYVS